MLNDAGELLGFRGVNKDISLREDMERSLRRRTLELEALLEAARAIAATIDYDDVLRRIARAAGEALGTAECVIWEHSPEADLAEFCCLWERDPVPGVAAGLIGASYPIRTHPGGLDGLHAGVVVQQSRSDPDLAADDAADMDRWGEKTWLIVPLVLEERLLGVMILIESARERRFDADEVRMAGVIGEQAAVALHNALRHRREERHNRWLRSLVSAGRAISEAQDPDTTLGEVARLAAEAMQSPAAFIYEYARDRDALVTRARHRARTPAAPTRSTRSSPSPRLPRTDARWTGRDPRGDPVRPGAVRRGAPAHGGFGEQSLLTVPLSSRGEILGVLVLIEDERERVFTGEEIDFMAAFGEQVTLALTTARSATTDGLTGLANHRVFYERLGQELARAQRYGTPVSLLMIDIDDFKELNDTLWPSGRRRGASPAGRTARRTPAPRASTCRRATAARSSPSCSPTRGSHRRSAAPAAGGARPDGGAPSAGHSEGAEALAERLRGAVAETDFPVAEDGSDVHMTVSVGVASYPDMAGNMDDLVARADAALYAAKRAGKDRVEVYWRREPAPAGADVA